MAIVTNASRRMADASASGTPKGTVPGAGGSQVPREGKATGVKTADVAGERQNRGRPDSGGVKLREEKVAVPGDEPQGVCEVTEAPNLQASGEPRHKP